MTVEVKSQLNKDVLDDIFTKSAKLRAMGSPPPGLSRRVPVVTAFAYECANLNLAFFDFAVRNAVAGLPTPDIICILNQGVFGLIHRSEGQFRPEQKSRVGTTSNLHSSRPAMTRCICTCGG